MRVELIKDMRIKHKAGETVEVSPGECNFLLSIGVAKLLSDKPQKDKPQKAAKK